VGHLDEGRRALERAWEGSGSGYRLEWGGLEWTVEPGASPVGFRAEGLGPLLALEGLAASGRRDADAFGAASLRGVEVRQGRLEATFVPQGWPELTVRAAWWPVGERGVGLEVELGTRSVGELRGVEVLVRSQLGGAVLAGAPRSVEPRDARAAALSYDGREPDVAGLTTEPPGPVGYPWLVPQSGREGATYLEMVHPDDAARRVHVGRLPYDLTVYGLFGYDLERGVVLRGRMRGFWLPKAAAYTEAERLYAEFLREPPPLTT
jgi:hypothetical protein